MPNIPEGKTSEPTTEGIIREVAKEVGFGDELLVLDLVGGCGVTSQMTGHLWRVFEPASGRAFIICLAMQLYKSDIEPLGLDENTPFACYKSALDEETRAAVPGGEDAA